MRAHFIALTVFLSLPAGASDIACDGDACDVLSPLKAGQVQFEDKKAAKGWSALLGGVSGAIIGEEIGGVPGAVGIGALGLLLGAEMPENKRYWEDQARESRAAHQRGDDIFYNPAHRLPATPHYFRSPAWMREKD